ncbi:MAG: GFA family protein [Candidatus Sericytochromatia bacterium]
MQYKGSCHCKKVQFTVEGELTKALDCNCSHCSRKGFLLWFVEKDNFKLNIDETELSLYKFNRHLIDHRFCPVCGCQPFGFGKDPATEKEMVALNIRCLEDIDLSSIDIKKVDGKSF